MSVKEAGVEEVRAACSSGVMKWGCEVMACMMMGALLVCWEVERPLKRWTYRNKFTRRS
jgi:hypothetical protein